MGRKRVIDYDRSRDQRYSAYVYAGDLKFRKSVCLERKDKKKKQGDCVKWKVEYLDLRDKEDANFIKFNMILVPESEL
jgi:hypothetical protein